MASGGLKIIRNTLEQLPASERKIAEYILANPQAVIDRTVSELGQEANTSGAAVIRLCKSLGLKGYQELKMRIAGDLVKPEEHGYRDIAPGESYYSIVQKTVSNSIQSMKDTTEMLHHDELETAVQTLLQAKNVHFFGIGASHIIAVDAQQKLLRINRRATAFTDVHLVATLIANADSDDVLFAISYSGETPEAVSIVSLAKKQNMKTISLTKYGQNTVSSLADIHLYTSDSTEAPFRSAATTSRLSQLLIIDFIFLCMATAEYGETIEHIDKTREAIQYLKDHQ